MLFRSLGMALVATSLIFFGHQIWIVALLMAVWGFIGTSAPVAWNTWLTRTLPNDTELGGGLMVAIIQLAITLGATLGGVLFDAQGYQSTFIFSALILVLSAVFSILTWRHLLHVKYQ